MEIYLVRHGDYVDQGSHSIEQDSRNQLSEVGVKKLQQEAGILAKWKVPVGRIVTSPFVRAKQTAKIIAEALNVPVDEHVGLTRTSFNIQVLQQILSGYSQIDSLMLVGHESDLSKVASAVIGGGALLLDRGGIIRITLDTIEPPQGKLVWLLSPEVMAAIS